MQDQPDRHPPFLPPRLGARPFVSGQPPAPVSRLEPGHAARLSAPRPFSPRQPLTPDVAGAHAASEPVPVDGEYLPPAPDTARGATPRTLAAVVSDGDVDVWAVDVPATTNRSEPQRAVDHDEADWWTSPPAQAEPSTSATPETHWPDTAVEMTEPVDAMPDESDWWGSTPDMSQPAASPPDESPHAASSPSIAPQPDLWMPSPEFAAESPTAESSSEHLATDPSAAESAASASFAADALAPGLPVGDRLASDTAAYDGLGDAADLDDRLARHSVAGDPFADDPFGDDPFGDDPRASDALASETLAGGGLTDDVSPTESPASSGDTPEWNSLPAQTPDGSSVGMGTPEWAAPEPRAAARPTREAAPEPPPQREGNAWAPPPPPEVPGDLLARRLEAMAQRIRAGEIVVADGSSGRSDAAVLAALLSALLGGRD